MLYGSVVLTTIEKVSMYRKEGIPACTNQTVFNRIFVLAF